MTETTFDPAKAAKLKYTDCSVEILNFIHSKEDEDSGSPYNCGFDVCVRSGAFAGRADGCEYDYKAWKEFVNRLEELYRFKTDRADTEAASFFQGTARGISRFREQSTETGRSKRLNSVLPPTGRRCRRFWRN